MSRLNDCVSVIIPVTRIDKIKGVIYSIYRFGGIPRNQLQIVWEEDKERIGCPKMIDRLVSKTDNNLILFFMDDAYAEQDLIKNALLAMNNFSDGIGLVGLNDHYHSGDKLATAWLSDRRMLNLLDGQFANTQYKHCFWDNELIERCKELGKYFWCEEARFFHDHPIVKGISPLEQDDEIYKLAYRPDVYYRDMRLFKRRKANEWRM